MTYKTITRLLLYSIFLLFNIVGISQEPADGLKENLSNLNSYWEKAKVAIVPNVDPLISLSENQLVELHLTEIENLLRKKPKVSLSVEQKNKRLFCLDKLNEYRNRKTFPTNTFHKKRTPYFVDIFGTHCAVAYLMLQTGEKQLISTIKDEHNYSYLDELAKEYDQILKWAKEHGFTIEELGWIQPTYGPISQEMFPVGNGDGIDGEVTIMEVSPDKSTLYLAGNFTMIDGVEANSIVGWTGNEWFTLGSGVEGEIFDLHFHNNIIYIVGKFITPGADEYSSIAYWNNENWISVAEYSGDIYAIETYEDRLYIGGGFHSLDGLDISFLAFYDEIASSWSNSSYVYESGGLISLPDIFSVNDTVRTFAIHDNQLFVGGDFTYTSPNASHPNLIHYEVTRYARWFEYLWIPGPDLELETVSLLQPTGDSLFIISPMVGFTTVHTYSNAIVYQDPISFGVLNQEKPPMVHGHVKHNEKKFFYGNLKAITTFTSEGLYHLNGGSNGQFSDQVTAAVSFKGYIYFAGDFTSVFGQPFNGLARSLWGGMPVEAKEPDKESALHFYTASKLLHIKSTRPIRDSKMKIYGLNGQLHKSIALNENSNKITIDLQDLPEGLFVFQFVGSEISRSEIMSVF